MPRKSEYPKQIKNGSYVVTIYKTPPGFTVVYYQAGKRKREWAADAKAAESIAKERAGDIPQGLGTCPLTPLQIEACQRALAIIPKDTSIETVVDEWLAWKERQKASVQSKPVTEIVAELAASKQGLGRSERYVSQLESLLDPFGQQFQCALDGITAQHVERWLGGLKGGARTRNNHLDALKLLANFAKGRGYVSKEWAALEAIGRATESDSQPCPYSPEELDAILEACLKARRESWRMLMPWIAIGGLAGVREAERRRLTPESYLPKERVLVLERNITKTKRRRIVPVVNRLAKILDVHGVVMPVEPAARFGEFMADLGLENRHNGLRDGFISYSIALGTPKHLVAEQAGNSVRKIEESYQSLRLADGRVITRELALKWFGLSESVRKRK